MKKEDTSTIVPGPVPEHSRKQSRSLFRILPFWLRNKYFLFFAAFCVIVLFLDKNDFFSQYQRIKELRQLEKSKQYYTSQIETERKELEALKTNPAIVEKYAREKYLMKRDNEEVFLIPENYDTPKN